MMGLLVFLRGGVNLILVTIYLGAVGLFCIPWYFGTRDRAKPATGMERFFAASWVWFRRIICFSFGLMIIVGSLFTLVRSEGGLTVKIVLGTILMILLGIFGIYVGLIGQGPNRQGLKDDFKLHEENKKRYDWRS